ncbi:MAG: hypothetical protein HY210_04495 [Candidatus Omnitrophica bacterium]|nr:hypothetical protein [Candidatus Omnitrophota bacterium]
MFEKKVKRFCLVLLILISFNALVSCASIDKAYEKDSLTQIDKEDGISAEEAIVVARMYIIEKNITEGLQISRPKVNDSKLVENCWTVKFRPNMKGILMLGFSYSVDVDKATGEVRLAGVDK